MDPYRGLAPLDRPPVFLDGPSVVVAKESRLPAICLKCAARKHVHFTPRSFKQVSQSSQAMGGAGGAVGASVAAGARATGVSVAELLLIVVVLGGVVGLIVFLVQSKAPSTEMDVPMCDQCTEAMTAAAGTRRVLLAAVLAALAVAILGALAESAVIGVVGMIAFLAMCIVIVRAKLQKWNFFSPRIDETHVWINGAVPEALAALDAHLRGVEPIGPKRKKKKKPSAPAPATSEPEPTEAS